MQIRLTVLGPRGGRGEPGSRPAPGSPGCDVLVTAPAGTPLAAVVGGLADAVAAAAGAPASPSGPAGNWTGVPLFAGSARLDPDRSLLGEPPLVDGAVLSLGAPAAPAQAYGTVPVAAGAASAHLARLQVVAGPDAGGVHLLHGGQIRIGRSAEADVPLDDPDVSRLHCVVTVGEDGGTTVADLGSTNGTTVDGAPVHGTPATLPPGSVLRIGESALRIAAGGGGLGVSGLGASGPGGSGPGRPGPEADVPGVPGRGTYPSGSAAPSASGEPPPDGVPGPRGTPSGSAGDGAYAGEWPAPAPYAPGAHSSPPPAHEDAGPRPHPYGDGPPDGTTRRGATPLRGTPAPDWSAPPPGVPARGIKAWARRLAGTAPSETGRPPQSAPHPEDTHGSGLSIADELAKAEAAALHERWPDPSAVLLTALGPGPRLWERGPDHPDALQVRLGTADRPTGGTTSVTLPLTVGLRQTGSLGLAGPRPRLTGLARSVVAQLAALHAPAGLELVLISTDRSRSLADRIADWSWLGWLPQLHPARGQDCRLLTAYDREQAAARIAELTRRLDAGPPGSDPAGDPASGPARSPAPSGPAHTVVVVDGDPGGAALREATTRLAARGPAAGIHLLCLAETPAATPASPLTATYAAACAACPPFAESGAVALLSGDVATGLRLLHRPAGSAGGPQPPPGADRTAHGTGDAWLHGPGPAAAGPDGWLATAMAGGASGAIGTVDAVSAAWAERLARALAPLREPEPRERSARAAGELPESVRLLDELGLARATPTALTARWAEQTRALAVFGAGPAGPLEVDLVAPRALHVYVEGPPGSGKTELLRSLAASLAASERPDRLRLILLDGGAAERGEGLKVCTDLPHVTTYLPAADPVRMREFAQELAAELKRRAELLAAAAGAAAVPGQRGTAEGQPPGVRARDEGAQQAQARARAAQRALDALPRVVVVVDDYDALVAPALGSTARPAAGSVVRALDAVAREGARLGLHMIAASGRPERTAGSAPDSCAGLRATLDAPPGRGVLRPAGGAATPFQAGRVTGRIPRTATARPTVVPLEWERMGAPPTSRPLRELGNGPTDLALLASALQRAALHV